MHAIRSILASMATAVIIGSLLAGCGPAGPAGAPAQTPTPAPKPTVSPLTPAATDIVFRANCGNCHSLPTAAQLKEFPTDTAMSDFVKSMAQFAGLNSDETLKVLDYTLALRRGP